MPDLSVVAAVISTTGPLLGALGALGGVALTHRFTIRREEAQFARQREDQRTQERHQAHADLLGAVTQLKSQIEILGSQHWKDMNVRLVTIQQHAVSAGLHASRVALLCTDTAQDALALASAASRLVAATTTRINMGYQGDQFLGGQLTRPVDFTDFDQCVERFRRAAAQFTPSSSRSTASR